MPDLAGSRRWSRGRTPGWGFTPDSNSHVRARGSSWPCGTRRAVPRRPITSGGGCRAARLEVRRLDLAELASVRRLRGTVPGAGRAPRPARQQRRHHGDPAADHCRRVRDAARHQPPGALRPHRAGAARAARGGPARRPGARVVTLSSTLHRRGRLRRDDLMGSGPIRPSARTGSPSWPTCSSCVSFSAGRTPPASGS